jgi:outer membrane protein
MPSGRASLLVAAGLALGFPLSPALAQSLPTLPEGTAETALPAAGNRYTVELGAGVAPEYEGSEDYRFVPLWHLRAQDLYGPTTFVDLFGPRLTSNLVPHPNLRLGPMLQYVPKRGSVDNNRVDDLENVDPALMLGVTGGWDFLAEQERSLGVFAEVRADVANGHGWLVTPGVRGHQALAHGFSLGGSLTTTWASESYMSDYFGVDETDARRSGLDSENADAGFKDIALSGALTYRFTETFQLGVVARYSRLLGDAADSPIVDDEGNANQFFGGLLVGARF